MATHKLLKERWVAIDGSVWTERKYPVVSNLNKNCEQTTRQAVMFNVGDDVAKHVVTLHNSTILQPSRAE